MNIEIWFDKDELNLIYEDQFSCLSGMHPGIGKNHKNANLARCPKDHFNKNSDYENISTRQSIMIKIQEASENS